MVFQNLLHILPMPFLLGGLDPGSLLDGLDFIELIFSVLNQVTFLVDIFIGAALIGAIVRGVFKKFWKVVWRGIVFLALVGVLYAFSDTLSAQLHAIPIPLKGEINGTMVEFKNLGEMIPGVIEAAGYNAAYTEAMSEVIFKNLVIFLGVPLLAIVTPIISGITFPFISLLLPKKMKTLKLIPAKLAISIAFSLIAIIIFAIPMATLVPPMTEFKALIADDTLMKKFLNPEFIGFLELFTAEKSILLKVVNLGNVAGSLNIFNTFKDGATVVKLSDALPALFTQLNQITYASAS